MPKKLLSPEAARDFLVRRFDNQHAIWLAGGGDWPLSLPLGVPTEKEIAENVTGVRSWASAWQEWTGPGVVQFEDRQFVRLGRQRLPATLNFENAYLVAAAVGQEQQWKIAEERYRRMAQRWPSFKHGRSLASRFDVLSGYSGEDFERLMSLLEWLMQNPASNLYLRQLPVEGLDTKWVEKCTGLVAALLHELRGTSGAASDFHVLCGLRKPPHRIRIRLLCPKLRQQVGGLGDIEAPIDELASLPIKPESVLIVENQETGLALPDHESAVAIMRLGNAVSVLKYLHWLEGARAVYWGDIDTHGFSILDRARGVLPQLQSVLMDESTLLEHRLLWVQEHSQSPNVPLTSLTDSERNVYNGLQTNIWGQKVRLEQERLDWNTSLVAIAQAMACAPRCKLGME